MLLFLQTRGDRMVALSRAGRDRLEEEEGAWLLERLPPWLARLSAPGSAQTPGLPGTGSVSSRDRSPDHVLGVRWALLLDPLRAPSQAPRAFRRESLQGSCVSSGAALLRLP